MFFVSKFQNNSIIDAANKKIGKVKDLVASLSSDYPQITALEIKKNGNSSIVIDWRFVRVFEESSIFLGFKIDDIPVKTLKEDEVFLIKDLLDKQIVDTEDRKVIRVQDIQLSRINNTLRIMAVDISFRAVIRRLGLDFLTHRLDTSPNINLIDWKSINLISRKFTNLKLKVSQEKLSVLHPSDIAEIVSTLSPKERTAILASLDEGTAADTIGELDESQQADALSLLGKAKAGAILGEMAPDEAADVIGDLPQEKANELLRLMDEDEAAEVKELLEYPENSAGGVMTTDYISVNPELKAEDVINFLRKEEHNDDNFYYIYVTDPHHQLLGVFSLKELILAHPSQKVKTFMSAHPVTVSLLDDQKEAAAKIAKYNLTAIPVIDTFTHIKGIITVDDALDIVLPTAWKKRVPKMFK